MGFYLRLDNLVQVEFFSEVGFFSVLKGTFHLTRYHPIDSATAFELQ